MNLLGVDFGLSKIGLSFSEGELASPLPIQRVKNPEEAFSKIALLVDLNKVEKIVIGIPKPDSIGAEKFASRLERTLELPVVRVDEAMTTTLANKRKPTEEDSVAAAIMLQEYINNSKGESLAI